MTDTEVFENKENMPLESYEFTYSEAEYDEVRKSNLRSFLVRTVVLAVAFVAITAGIVTSDMTDFFGGLLAGWTLMYLVISLASMLGTRKNWKVTKAKICSSVFKYEVFGSYLLLTVTKDGECVHFTKLEYDKLRRKTDTGRFYLLDFANQGYMIKKHEIADNSIFHSLKPKAPEKPSAKLRSLSIVLLVLSVVSGIGGFIVTVGQVFASGTVAWWCFIAFGTIPLISFVFGVYMKKYGVGRGNVIAGLLALAFLFGMFYASVSGEDADIEKGQQILSIESYIGVDLPEPYSYDNFSDSINGIYYEDTAMQFYSKDVEYLESLIQSSENWSEVLNDETSQLVAEVGTFDDWDFISVYNITNDEYNKIPENAGTYSMSAMYYDMESNGLYVTEYEYVK